MSITEITFLTTVKKNCLFTHYRESFSTLLLTGIIPLHDYAVAEKA